MDDAMFTSGFPFPPGTMVKPIASILEQAGTGRTQRLVLLLSPAIEPDHRLYRLFFPSDARHSLLIYSFHI